MDDTDGGGTDAGQTGDGAIANGDGEADDDAAPTDAEVACFEAGIKMGALYHQFAGTPISPASADDLARAIESAIGNQPFCEAVTVEIDHDAVERATTEWGYTEFTGEFATVEVLIATDEARVIARMADEDGYPRMRVVSVDGESGDSPR